MFATQTMRVKKLTREEFETLRQLSRYSKNLYNVALYTLRQHFFKTGKLLGFNKLYKSAKANESYAMLQAGVSQQTLRKAHEAMKSFLSLKRLAVKGKYPTEKVSIPKYLPKDGYYPIVCSTNAISIHDGFFQVPMSRQNSFSPIKIGIPDRLNGLPIREVRINPKHQARFLEAEFVYQMDVRPTPLRDDILSIDLGVNNFASCIDTLGQSFLVDGKRIKSENQWYNKERSRLQSVKDLQGIKTETNRLAAIAFNRENFIRDYMSKSAHLIVKHCLQYRIGTVVVGVNPGWKQNINIGHRNNQNFVQIPYWKFRRFLGYLCEKNGIQYLEITESYTSKSSFLDRDEIPEYQAGVRHTFSGRRISRGLYRSGKGQVINADLNGSANILRKAFPDTDLSLVDKGILRNPVRLYPLHTCKAKVLCHRMIA
ncbi:putative transposase [Peptococcaceae bacterium CEB3]|nr:putative transposase [Peptococcaceae bacterium CEB3]KLU61802.1 putative transposase [Peptococcaceae bacterium CEB3]